MKSKRFLDALNFKNTGVPPIWLMRQAGRYLPEYRALRSQYEFMEMVKNPQVVSEITSQPIKRFQFDAAILFCDILVIPDALGMPVEFKEKVGPVFQYALNTKNDLKQLKQDAVKNLNYVAESIGLIKEKIDVPLIGFAGAPFTVGSYMIEGGSSKTLAKTKAWLLSETAAFHELMELLTNETIAYLNMQIDAGVDAIQIFDTWAGALSQSQFKEHSLPYLKKIVASLNQKVPVILFSKAATSFADEFEDTGAQGIAFDITANLAKQRKKYPHLVIQGNFDPDALLATPDTVRKEARKILDAMKHDSGFIFNLGHGIHPETPLESVYALIEEVRRA